MPYNTRRKSLSLPSLGIRLPMTLAQRAAAAAAAAASNSLALNKMSSSSSSRLRRSAPSDSEDEPQTKRAKNSHGASSRFDRTPPPSPRLEEPNFDAKNNITSAPWSNVDDDVVRASMEQLYVTGNRPHLIKELAEVLSQKLNIMKQSANPSAIVASRLSGFIKRSSWTPKSPCPIGKALETVHPRRTYFFLTTCPRLPLPESGSATSNANDIRLRTFLSPEDSSDASAASDEEAGDDDDDDLSVDSSAYRQRSLSPEVDLSSPEFDSADDVDDVESDAQSRPWLKYRRGRGPPPPLEKDEHEFTQTATGLQKRKFDGSHLAPSFCETSEPESELAFIDDLPKYDLWANEPRVGGIANSVTSSYNLNLKENSSPHKKDAESDHWVSLGPSVASWECIPETIDLDELDSLLESC